MPVKRRSLCWPDASRFETFSDHQQQEYYHATGGYISLLSGKPGTGKTYVSAAVVKEIQRLPVSSVAVCAPTGKAAVRCTGAMEAHGINLQAKTIHRTLGIHRTEGGAWQFMFGPDNPLPYSHLVVDETSMLGTGLGAYLFAACREDTHILLVGDTFQLPPVDHGAVLRDLIEIGLPHGQLSQIRRNSGAIVKACHAIANGKRYETCDSIDEDAGDNLMHVEVNDPGLQIRKLLQVYEIMPKRYDRKWDMQVIVPLNAKSPVSRTKLNDLLQERLNHQGKRSEKHGWRNGDKILCTRNCFRPSTERANQDEHFIANGEVGEILEVEDKRIISSFLSPHRVVVIPLGKVRDKDDEKEENLNVNFDKGYALTVHKAQGSQWPVVVCMADESSGARMVGCREFHYTALSRAERVCITIGERRLIDLDCQKTSLGKRKTFLSERVLSAINR